MYGKQLANTNVYKWVSNMISRPVCHRASSHTFVALRLIESEMEIESIHRATGGH